MLKNSEVLSSLSCVHTRSLPPPTPATAIHFLHCYRRPICYPALVGSVLQKRCRSRRPIICLPCFDLPSIALPLWDSFLAFDKVVELKPQPQVTVIDTDMEIDLDLPDEAREQLEAKGARDRAQTLRAHMDPVPTAAVSAGGATGVSTGHSLRPTAPPAVSRLSPMGDSDSESDSDEESTAAQNAFDPEKHRLIKLEGLPEEPAQDDEGVFTCQLRSSQGKFARRFRYGDVLGVLLDFAEAHGGIPGHYRVVMPFPRKVFTRDGASTGVTLKEAGLTSKQEAVILETF